MSGFQFEPFLLFIDDDVFILKALKRLLRKKYSQIECVTTAGKALEVMSKNEVCVVVAGMVLPDMNVIELFHKIKSEYPGVVRLALSGNAHFEQVQACINTGEVYRYVTKPVEEKELLMAINDGLQYYSIRRENYLLMQEMRLKNEQLQTALFRQEQINLQLRRLTVIDELTELYNERFIETSLDKMLRQHMRYDHEFSCLLLSIDGFSFLSDVLGERLLIDFSVQLKSIIRAADMGFRVGASCFMVLLPYTDYEKAVFLGQRIQAIFASCRVPGMSENYNFSLSMAVLNLDTHSIKNAEQMIEMAFLELHQLREKNGNTREMHGT
jgi:diguanylate cyclase (GGDEF)-like protein